MKPTAKTVEFFLKNDWSNSQLEAAGYVKDGGPTPAIITALQTAGWDEDMLLTHGMVEALNDAPKPDEKVARYIGLRDEIADLKKQLKEKEQPLKEEMESIQLDLTGALNDSGQTSMASDYGTFFFVDKTQVNVSDFEAYQQWFVNAILNRLTAKGFMREGTSQYDASDACMDALSLNFMTQAVRKEAVLEHIKEYGQVPAGISTEQFQEVQVRRASKAKK